MPRGSKKKFSRRELMGKGFPVVLVTSILLLASSGIDKLSDLKKVEKYRDWVAMHPVSGKVSKVVDGDTLEIDDGSRTIRMLGINAPDRDDNNGYTKAKMVLAKMLEGRSVWLEYDRYQDDKYARLLVWVWLDCEGKPDFLPYDYMHLSFNRSREGLKNNPKGCREGKLVNEEMVKKNLVKVEFFKDRGELKYQKRLLAK